MVDLVFVADHNYRGKLKHYTSYDANVCAYMEEQFGMEIFRSKQGTNSQSVNRLVHMQVLVP